jgi:hypothetical protein
MFLLSCSVIKGTQFQPFVVAALCKWFLRLLLNTRSPIALAVNNAKYAQISITN